MSASFSEAKKKSFPLHTAIEIANESGKIHFVTSVISAGADVNEKNSEGATPLHWAAKYCNLELVQLLLDEDADPNITDKKGRKFYEVTDSEGNTLLHIAIHKGKIDFARELIAFGANVNTKNDRGETPLYLAALYWDVEFIQLLLEHKADSNIGYGKSEIKFHAVTNEDGSTLLHVAVCEGEIDFARKLIALGADVNVKNNRGETPLHFAAYLGNLESIQLLLESKAKPDIKDCDGREFHQITNSEGNTLLHIAIYKGKIDFARELIALGANVEAENNQGEKPRHLAVYRRDFGLLQLLLDTQDKLNRKDNGEEKALLSFPGTFLAAKSPAEESRPIGSSSSSDNPALNQGEVKGRACKRV